MSAGLILPAGSPLVQFEVQRAIYRRDVPFIAWVNRIPEALRQGDEVLLCTAECKVLFRLDWENSGYLIPPGDGYHYSVCLCMGRFIE